MIERRLLAIYLNDHLAGATGGVELARRVRASNRGTRWGPDLERVCSEVEADRDTLQEIMETLEIRRSTAKVLGGWSAEKLGRLKPNGQLKGYSPLSRLIELEMLQIGIAGKLAMWQSLRSTAGPELSRFDLSGLIVRAHSQREVVQQLHLDAAAVAFAQK